MKHSEITVIRSEIATFADDVDDIVYEGDGTIIFERMGKIYKIQLIQKGDGLAIKYNGEEYSYKEFLAKELAHLEFFAKKIQQKDDELEELSYVDPDAVLVKVSGTQKGKALDVLRNECDQPAWLGARIVFVTADAGHGKSFLLKQFQRKQVKKYLENKSDYIFWHIDLHGRELVRLNEAIMYELGDLRITGIYYNSIITLIKNGLIILAIDGFDELAAEKGGDVALGSLTNLVTELGGDGILVAASRRSFFNTQDYIQRAGLMNQKVSADCEFDEIRLQNWQEKQCVDYLNIYYHDGQKEFDSLKNLFRSSASHPLLERPFLFTKIVSFAKNDKKTPFEFVSHGGENDLDSINNIIGAFVRREVTKWSTTEKDTGKPYLDFDQHMRLLSEVANEMWEEQKDSISIDTIAFILAILFDEWNTDISLRPTITRMAESHALLPISTVGDRYRRFDHEEFRNYFLALALETIIKDCKKKDNFSRVFSFMKKAQLPDSVSQYLILQLKIDDSQALLDGLMKVCQGELKTTYAQPNIGTLIPYILDQIRPSDIITIGNKIVFSSLVFENKTIKNVKFHDCTFINISFCNTKMENVSFDACSFTDIRFNNINYHNNFSNVVIADNCMISKVTVVVSEDDNYSEYSPSNIDNLLIEQGIYRMAQDDDKKIPEVKNTEYKKALKRFLNKFMRAAYLYEKNIKDEPIYNARNKDIIFEEIIPLLLKYNIIEEVETSQTHQANTRAWKLKQYTVPNIYKSEEDEESELYHFWKEVNNHA